MGKIKETKEETGLKRLRRKLKGCSMVVKGKRKLAGLYRSWTNSILEWGVWNQVYVRRGTGVKRVLIM